MPGDPSILDDPLSLLEAQRERLDDLEAMLTGVLAMSREEMCEGKGAVLRERLLCKALELLEDISGSTRAALDELAAPPREASHARARSAA